MRKKRYSGPKPEQACGLSLKNSRRQGEEESTCLGSWCFFLTDWPWICPQRYPGLQDMAGNQMSNTKK